MYSGGKDSTYAIEHCRNKGYRIKYLISVKPTRTDCYLFHYATVEHTKELANILGYKHFLLTCDVADPQKEADLIKQVVAKDPVDALVLGGTGLQGQQIKSLRDALFDLGVEVFATHTGMDHGELVAEMIAKGYDIRITQIAAEGLTDKWLGKKIDANSFVDLRKLSDKYGFHIGAEGGHYDTLVVDGPIFHKRLELVDAVAVMDGKYSGYLHAPKIRIVEKQLSAVNF